LVLDQRRDGLGEDTLALDVRARRADGLLGRCQPKEGIGGIHAHVEPRQLGTCGGARDNRARQIDRRAARAEIKGFPREQQTAGAAPNRRCRRVVGDRPGDARDDRAREQQSGDVIAGSAVDL
jgi:hypothetical protein